MPSKKNKRKRRGNCSGAGNASGEGNVSGEGNASGAGNASGEGNISGEGNVNGEGSVSSAGNESVAGNANGEGNASACKESSAPDLGRTVMCIDQKITGTNIQIGHGNTIEDRRKLEKEEPSISGNTEIFSSLPGSASPNKTYVTDKSYAEVVSGKKSVVSQSIHATNVTININSNATHSENDIKSSAPRIPMKREQSASFLDSVGRFKKGHFILVVGKQNCAQYFDELAIVPWTAVLDFDPESRSIGLLSRIEAELKNWRSLHICSIQDVCTVSEHITNWIFLMGCADRADTRTSTKANEWKKQVEEEIDQKIAQLKEFQTGITYFTFVVIWPVDPDTAKCMRFIVEKVCTRLKSLVVIVDTGETKSSQSDQNLEVLNDESEVTTVQIGLKEMCLDIRRVISPKISKSTVYRLPTKDKTNDPRILEEKVQWLKEDFEVLYLDNVTGTDFSVTQLEQEEDTFRKGGNLPWSWWYQVGPGHADVKRDVMDSVINSIKVDHLKNSVSGIITLLHSPGCGGTTLSQRILWELKEIAPCAQIKHNSVSPLIDLVEKIAFLSDKTGMPVIILLDGEDEHRIRPLYKLANRISLPVIMLYVKRYSGDFSSYKGSRGVFFLPDKVSKREATLLMLQLNKKTEKEKRQENLKRLLKDVEDGEHRTIFEFGLAAHSYEYKSLQSYVRAHLNLSDSCKELLPWQTSLAYLALAYFYGHSSMPCHFFSKMLQSTEKTRILETKDFPQEMQEFIVRALNESRMYTVRISHYYVAKEILDQVLTRNVERPVSPNLCKGAKKMLSAFCLGFIKTAGEVNAGNSSDVISRILINTFIKRENKDILEDETQEQRLTGPHKPQFSHILEDASSAAPFTERFEILQQLVDTFNLDPQYRAHLGRLFMICRPEEKQKAEENLKKAYEMCAPVLEKVKLSSEEVPLTKRQDTRNICHMFGNMLSRKVFKYTGKCSTSEHAIDEQKYQFPGIAESLLPDVQLACTLFSQTREVMSPGYEDYLGFVGEIQVRLVFCRLIRVNCGTDLQTFIQTHVSAALVDFVLDCYEKLDDLFAELECIADKESIGLLQDIYVDIMRPASLVHIIDKHMETTQRTRQSIITTLQAQYNAKNFRELLGKLQQEVEINFIVKHYEETFQTNCETNRNLDKDFRNWIDAIRHPLYKERYLIDKVYGYVKRWYEHVEQQERQWKKSEATFYLFVLSSLLGFGTYEQPGNVELLRQSQRLKRILHELVKYSNIPYGQLEWLGPAVQTIDRLKSGKLSTDENDMEDLEIRIGTICPPNNKPNYGLISLDLGPENRESVKVVFAPKRWGMKGQSNRGHRVEFVIGFNKKHGYEAFKVKPIGHVKCTTPACGNVETRSCDRAVQCPKCLKTTQIDTKDEMSRKKMR